MGQQAARAVAERVHRRLVPSVQQHDHRRDDLVLGQPITLVGDLHQLGDQVVPRVAAPGRCQGLDVADELIGGSFGPLPFDVVRGELVHLDDRVRPVQQQRAVLPRYPEQLADDRNGVRLGIVGNQVDGGVGGRVADMVDATLGRSLPAVGPLTERPVEHLGGDPLDRRTHRGHRLRGEHLGHQPPDPGVVGRFQVQQRIPLGLLPPLPTRIGVRLAELLAGVAVQIRAPSPRCRSAACTSANLVSRNTFRER